MVTARRERLAAGQASPTDIEARDFSMAPIKEHELGKVGPDAKDDADEGLIHIPMLRQTRPRTMTSETRDTICRDPRPGRARFEVLPSGASAGFVHGAFFAQQKEHVQAERHDPLHAALRHRQMTHESGGTAR